MARNQHLTWTEIKDFGKGLWTESAGFLMPADGFQKLENASPQVGGGVRAFFKPSLLSTSGIGSTSLERPIWIESMFGQLGVGFLLFTTVVSSGVMKAYYRDVGDTSWTLTKTFAAPPSAADPTIVMAVKYNAAGHLYWAVGVGHAGADSGIWLMDAAAHTWSQIGSVALGGTIIDSPPIIVYQARIVSTRLGTLVWTDPGGITYPVDNTLQLQLEQNDVRSGIRVLHAYQPSTLLVGSAEDGWLMVEGDLEDPVVTYMGKDHFPWFVQKTASLQDGVVFIEPLHGVFQTANMGANSERIDPQLTPFDTNIFQGVAQSNDYLFVPGGRVFDHLQQCWFTVAETTLNNFTKIGGNKVNAVTTVNAVYGVEYKSGFTLPYYTIDDSAGVRMETMTVKTAPLRSPEGRQVTIEEVEVYVENTHTAGTVLITVGGVTRTVALGTVGRHVVTQRFRARGQYLDVEVVSKSNTTDIEAPRIEAFRIGHRVDGHELLG